MTDARRIGRICAALSHPMRRAVLARLRDAEATDVESLAEDLPHVGTGSTEAGRLDVALHHVHLPKLAAAGLLEYDARSGSIRMTGITDLACDLLDVVAARTGDGTRRPARG